MLCTEIVLDEGRKRRQPLQVEQVIGAGPRRRGRRMHLQHVRPDRAPPEGARVGNGTARRFKGVKTPLLRARDGSVRESPPSGGLK